MALSQVGLLRRPVVHLDVDVRVIVAVPRRPVALVPDSLKVGRQAPWPGTADQQVAAVLEEEALQFGVFRAALVGGKPLVRWQGGEVVGRFARVEKYSRRYLTPPLVYETPATAW